MDNNRHSKGEIFSGRSNTQSENAKHKQTPGECLNRGKLVPQLFAGWTMLLACPG